ncbi:MAG TPA: iron ABC transporter permease [Bacteroidia bacterium]|nr:iron ABC transporter permease [Bacteroidia bacterium]
MKRTYLIIFALLVLLFFAACLCSLFFGGSSALDTGTESGRFILYQIRIPKTLTAILSGASLSTAGLLLQVLFRNPLAGPYALGISSGASLMVALCMLALQGSALAVLSFAGRSVLILAALTGSVLVTTLLLLVSKRVNSSILLLLVGLMIAQICGALLGTMEYFADPSNLKAFVIWGLGSLSGTSTSDLPVFGTLVCLLLLSLLALLKPLNALLLGDDYAQNLGFHTPRIRFMIILVSSGLTGICTAFCGPIAFVGISIPILSRLVFKTSRQEIHLLASALMGSSLLLIADAVTHHVVQGSTLPVNVITTLIGAPLVLYTLFRTKQW